MLENLRDRASCSVVPQPSYCWKVRRCPFLGIRVGESVESALSALAAIFFGSLRVMQQFSTKNAVF